MSAFAAALNNQLLDQKQEAAARTENGAKAHASTDDGRTKFPATLDAFYALMRDVDPTDFLFKAWTENPLLCQCLIAFLRDPRDGKGEKQLGRLALRWLFVHHPVNFEKNLSAFLDVGRYDDPFRTLVATDALKDQEDPAWCIVRTNVHKHLFGVLLQDLATFLYHAEHSDEHWAPVLAKYIAGETKAKRPKSYPTLKRLTKHLRTSEAPARKLTLLAKWWPREGKAWDKALKRARKSGKGLLEDLLEANAPVIGKLMGQTNFVLRKPFLRRIVSLLNEALNTIEVHMTTKDYTKIDYEKVPSKAMFNYSREYIMTSRDTSSDDRDPGAFLRNDNERFTEYQNQLADGTAKVNAKGLQPHDLTKQYMGYSVKQKDDVIEAQWKTMREAMTIPQNTLCVMDVSGSMEGVPMQVCIALGLLISTAQTGPLHRLAISFDATPRVCKITGDSLYDQVKCAEKIPWGGSTDLEATFGLIHDLAVQSGDAPKNLVIFSDMQFNEAVGSNAGTIFEQAKAKFSASGIELPRIVYWNLRPAKASLPVQGSTPNTVLMSGFSAELVKYVLDPDAYNPERAMLLALMPYASTLAVHSDHQYAIQAAVFGAKKKKLERLERDAMVNAEVDPFAIIKTERDAEWQEVNAEKAD